MSAAPHLPRKTDAARRWLAQPPAARSTLAPGLRMLLITVDGRKDFAALRAFAQGLGLEPEAAFGLLRAEGLLEWGEGNAPASPAAPPSPAAGRLMRAKFFALDLAARMLAGRDQALREGARQVDSETSFHTWIEHCAQAIAEAGGAERAALFRERVAG